MDKEVYKIIKRNLYNYNKTEELIKEREDELIWRSNGSNEAYLRGINQFNNSLENQIVKLCEDKKIRDIKRWKILNKKIFFFLCKKYPLYYEFLKLKYFKCYSEQEIQEALKINFKSQKIINDTLLEFIYKNAKLENLV